MPELQARSFDPGRIPWETVHDDGTKSATLVGDRGPGRMFTYAFFIPAGVFDAPHSHAADAHLHVASGALRLGYGTVLEQSLTERFPEGSFLFVPAHAIHFDGADVDTVLIGTATGPWSTDYRARSRDPGDRGADASNQPPLSG
ncbi:hypothetical protein ARHIZOSPH14_00050 [Agromyces rhizosphaerae]|uniref:Cupin domain-containing protein n=1 Tax=Agromyces rhizosphaerae TaxID=88374 RepID=A0A9W6CXP3_9MICO|nr:cupin domain-containing protein [Agromyces rhizosphaerae]GLI25763.1 hypothetical protein ARHIZOSPH14_00050 [Agromyces rhizosphaerae]